MNKIKSFFAKPIVPLILGLIIVAMGASLILQSTKWMWITGIVALLLGSTLVIMIMLMKQDLLGRNKSF